MKNLKSIATVKFVLFCLFFYSTLSSDVKPKCISVISCRFHRRIISIALRSDYNKKSVLFWRTEKKTLFFHRRHSLRRMVSIHDNEKNRRRLSSTKARTYRQQFVSQEQYWLLLWSGVFDTFWRSGLPKKLILSCQYKK